MERLFHEYIGMTPKKLSNLVRYQCLWRDIVSQSHFNILDAVYKYGYTDSSHLKREFKRYHSMSIRDFQRRKKGMPYIKINDLDVFYEEFGRGESLLFLHSHFSRGLLAFSAQIQPFSGKYRCLYPDFRGHGRTKCDSLAWNSRMIADDMVCRQKFRGYLQQEIFG